MNRMNTKIPNDLPLWKTCMHSISSFQVPREPVPLSRCPSPPSPAPWASPPRGWTWAVLRVTLWGGTWSLTSGQGPRCRSTFPRTGQVMITITPLDIRIFRSHEAVSPPGSMREEYGKCLNIRETLAVKLFSQRYHFLSRIFNIGFW